MSLHTPWCPDGGPCVGKVMRYYPTGNLLYYDICAVDYIQTHNQAKRVLHHIRENI